MQERQTEQAVPFGAETSIVQVADVEPFLIQARQVVIALPEGDDLVTGFGLVNTLLIVEAFAQILIFHLQLLVLFDQFDDLLLQRPQLAIELADSLFNTGYLCKNGLFIQTCSPH